MQSEFDAAQYASQAALAANAASEFAPRQTAPSMARGTFTPPRLRATDPHATLPVARVTIADLHLPVELVRTKATRFTEAARARGVRHSMKLWRTCYQQAMIALAREATGVSETSPCQAFFWTLQEREYHVSVTFGQAGPARLH